MQCRCLWHWWCAINTTEWLYPYEYTYLITSFFPTFTQNYRTFYPFQLVNKWVYGCYEEHGAQITKLEYRPVGCFTIFDALQSNELSPNETKHTTEWDMSTFVHIRCGTCKCCYTCLFTSLRNLGGRHFLSKTTYVPPWILCDIFVFWIYDWRFDCIHVCTYVHSVHTCV